MKYVPQSVLKCKEMYPNKEEKGKKKKIMLFEFSFLIANKMKLHTMAEYTRMFFKYIPKK